MRGLRALAGQSPDEWADELADRTGRTDITIGVIEAWEDPTGPTPPMHFGVIALQLAGTAAGLDLLSGLLSA